MSKETITSANKHTVDENIEVNTFTREIIKVDWKQDLMNLMATQTTRGDGNYDDYDWDGNDDL
jgi:hypothetical protein